MATRLVFCSSYIRRLLGVYSIHCRHDFQLFTAYIAGMTFNSYGSKPDASSACGEEVPVILCGYVSPSAMPAA